MKRAKLNSLKVGDKFSLQNKEFPTFELKAIRGKKCDILRLPSNILDKDQEFDAKEVIVFD